MKRYDVITCAVPLVVVSLFLLAMTLVLRHYIPDSPYQNQKLYDPRTFH